ncbi:hypothetical protein TNCV_3889021 [Trichonephila clavipes]|nr:hypothetical protein TNCV_3889021 [Trichonephila clavipes]
MIVTGKSTIVYRGKVVEISMSYSMLQGMLGYLRTFMFGNLGDHRWELEDLRCQDEVETSGKEIDHARAEESDEIMDSNHNSERMKNLVIMALYRSPLTVTLWPSSFLKKCGPMIPPAHKAHQTQMIKKMDGSVLFSPLSKPQKLSHNIIANADPSLNCGGGNWWYRHLSSLREFLRATSYCHLYSAQSQGQRQAKVAINYVSLDLTISDR